MIGYRLHNAACLSGLGAAIARPLSHSYGAIARNYSYPQPYR